jgi:hypothetical protein
MTSLADLSTMISYWRATRVSSLLNIVHKLGLYAFFWEVTNGRLSISAARGLDTGIYVTSRYSEHGFIFVFCVHLPSILYRFDVISAFPIDKNGGKTTKINFKFTITFVCRIKSFTY